MLAKNANRLARAALSNTMFCACLQFTIKINELIEIIGVMDVAVDVGAVGVPFGNDKRPQPEMCGNWLI